jgi:ribonucleoside-diphosphate reductase alpha chain
MNSVVKLVAADINTIPYQEASLDIWDKKYRLSSKNGEPIDRSMDDTYKRVARALADVERDDIRERWYERFLWALRHGAIPAGRVTSNAGALEHKPATSTINCTVSGTIRDSMDDILGKVHEAGLTLKAGCGIGYEFSTLRPRGAYVSGAGAYTSGPMSFMDIYDKMCFTVSSAGGRRGAQMGTFDVGHPDAMDFVRAKRENGRLRQFNLSLLVTDEFMQAVREEREWKLAFPISRREYDADQPDLSDAQHFVWREWPTHEGYVVNDEGLVACRVYKTVPARRMWDVIMSSTYDFAEPGFVLIDRMNEMNNNWWCENIRATNPCGEQGLPPYGACLLGSINLTRFVREPFTPQARFDWDEYRDVVRVFTRMLDNVVEINGLPLEQQRKEIDAQAPSRHGIPRPGIDHHAARCQVRLERVGQVHRGRVARDGDCRLGNRARAGARERPGADHERGVHGHQGDAAQAARRWRPMAGSRARRFRGACCTRATAATCSASPRRRRTWSNSWRRSVRASRITASIAPTGTISLSLANNASNGIEPSFAHHYFRNVIRPGRKTKEKIDVFSFELLAYRELVNARAMPGSTKEGETLPEYFTSADEVTPHQHVDIQAASQKWIDSSISKTANVPTNFPYEQFKSIYLYAHEQGLKGCTTFRFNPEAFQGVLVKEDDLKNTIYVFTLEDGTEVSARGDEEIEYDGESHSAANLFDALKEGYYGKF